MRGHYLRWRHFFLNMWFSYQQLIDTFGQEKADEMWAKTWKPTRKKDDRPEYRKLSETEHAKRFHKWLEEQDIAHTHIGNESGQWGTRNIVIMMAKKKAMWVSKWFPDYLCYVPIHEWWYLQVAIELKKAKWVNGWLNGSEIHDEQLVWINTINKTAWCCAFICHWYEDAISVINDIRWAVDQRTYSAFSVWLNQYVSSKSWLFP